jgi:glycosyltransferase involved in cell wall biosynthesis
MAIIHSYISVSKEYGGPARSVTQLCSALARSGLKVTLAIAEASASSNNLIMPRDQRVQVSFAETEWFERLFARQFGRLLARIAKEEQVSLIHDHGLWLPSNFRAANLAASHGIPYVLSPRGMLEPWAIRHRGVKKKAVMFLYQRKILESAALFFATSEQEVESIRRCGLNQPVALIPNGIDFSQVQSGARHEESKQVRTVLFLSRLHRVKGIEDLLDAWAVSRPKHWRLILAGGDESGYRSIVESRIVQLGLGDCVEVPGMVSGKQKSDLFADADLFVLPSYSENFGLVVAEALAHGVPVITTKGTPWQVIHEYSCGWWVDTGVESLTKALNVGMSMSSRQRMQMGVNGQTLVRARFAWPGIARDAVRSYQWLLGFRPKPACVLLE